MKKIRILLLFILCGMFVISSCKKDVAKPLESPHIWIENDRLLISSVSNAISFNVYIDGEKFTTNRNYYDLSLDNGSYEIEVEACGDGKLYCNSLKSNKVVYMKTSNNDETINYKKINTSNLSFTTFDDQPTIDEIIRFEIDNQMMDLDMWKHEENRFGSSFDNDSGFSGEYWGKTLRGACLAYSYTKDRELYSVLEQTVKNVLSNQEASGRISSYDTNHEFTGWDLWCRGYVLKGLEHFYEICLDDKLKAQIVDSLIKQVDYIMEFVGPNKKNILLATNDWGGLNSCNILEPIVNLYKMTGDKKYLDFAKYIVYTGGSTMLSSNGKNVLEDAIANVEIYKFGCRKLYELVNYFQGVLEYGLVTNDKTAIQAAINVYYLIAKTEITEVGGIATDVEEANNAVVEQSNPDNLGRMQELCVITAFSKLAKSVYLLTGDVSIIEILEKQFYNIIIGSINWNMCSGFVAFSYNPLSLTPRVNHYSGCAPLEDGAFQSCCIANSLFCVCQYIELVTMSHDDGLAFNLYFDGNGFGYLSNGHKVEYTVSTRYPIENEVSIKLKLIRKEEFTLLFRIPSYSTNTLVHVNGVVVNGVKAGDYLELTREWDTNDEITLSFDMRAYLVYGSESCSNPFAKYNVCVKRGPLTFARDSRIDCDIFKPLEFVVDDENYLDASIVKLPIKSQTGLKLKLTDGSFITLIDYGSAGKTESAESIMCTWIPTIDYYSCNIESKFVMLSKYDNTPISFNNNTKLFYTNKEVTGVDDPKNVSRLSFAFEKLDNGKYLLYSYESGGYLTITTSGEVTSLSRDVNNERQQFLIERIGLNVYRIQVLNDYYVSLNEDGLDNVYIYPDVKHIKQEWILVNID